VLKYKSLRIILALSVSHNTRLEQLDVKTAFLNANVKEDIYISIPEGIYADSNHVLKLNKALYGIKQAPREWHSEINGYLQTLKYKSCRKDSCIYVKQTNSNNIIIIGLFVDDMLVSYVAEDIKEWNHDKQELKRKYELSELGDVQHILGMKVTRQNHDLLITQETYIQDKLQLFGFDNAKAVTTPEITIKTKNDTNDNKVEEVIMYDQDVNTYRMMVGSLIYASISTRPDITHAVNIVSRYMSSPENINMIMLKRIFRYLTGTKKFGLLYSQQNNGMVRSNVDTVKNDNDNMVRVAGYCDADWGGDTSDRKSTTGYCTMLNGNLVSWCSKKQSTVALSSTEAEYMAINDVAKEIMWIRMILKELYIVVETPTIIYVDNQSAIRISENDSEHDRTKHIDIRHYFIRDLITNGEIKLQWIPTAEQLADMFTKPLGATTFTTLRDKLIKNMNNNNERL
jgi:hypothetical protein